MASVGGPPPPVPRHPESVPQDFICSICHELSLDPTLTPCEHLFCRDCIRESLQHRGECPVDRRPLARIDLAEAGGVLRRVYEGIAVRCPNERCDWTGVVGNYAAHSRRCGSLSVDPSVLAGLREEIQTKDRIIREKDELIQQKSELVREKDKLLEKKDELLRQSQKDLEKCAIMACEEVSQLMEKIRSLQQASRIVVDHDYKYDRTRVKELSLLICRYLENKPENVDRNRIYNCIKSCYDDLCRGWRDNPEYLHMDVRMLIHICLASNWFSEKQYGNLQSWAIAQFSDA